MLNPANHEPSNNLPASLTISTLFGSLSITQPVLIELIHSSLIQRLKKIHQYGIVAFIKPTQNHTRYDHSLDVLALLHQFGAPLEEQIAGLLHDASHTVFSHVGDVLFDHTSEKSSYQDDIHAWYLQKMNVETILDKHDIQLKDILHKSGAHPMLEQDLPHICADRLAYNLHDGLRAGAISPEQIKKLIEAIRFEQGNWYFADIEQARILGQLSLHLTEHVWGSAQNLLSYNFAGQILRHALTNNIITHEEVHFSTDGIIFNTLKTCDDPAIKKLMHRILNLQHSYTLTDNSSDYDLHLHPKLRGIDPRVKTDKGLQLLSALDTDFKHEYVRVKQLIHKGWFVKLKP